MKLSLYTFADEAFVPGVAALINSVRRRGFSGHIHVGSPEPLSIARQSLEGVEFHPLGSNGYWPGNRKAELALKHPSEHCVLMDADIVIANPTFFPRLEQWLETAPVVSVTNQISSIDYRRFQWAKRLGRPARPQHWPDRYYNAGFLACNFARDRNLIEEWDALIRSALVAPGALWTDVDFPLSDQDVLNALLQDWEGPLIGLSPPDIWAAAAGHYPFVHVGTFGSPAVLHGSGLGKSWQLKAPPPRAPHAYDLAWYDEVIRNPTPINLDITTPAPLRNWFERGFIPPT
jgi:hypothetical protein